MLVKNQSEEFSEISLSDYDTSSLGDVLRSHGVVQLPGFLPTALERAMAEEASELLRLYGRRVNVHVKSTGNTPRKYVSVSGNDVFAHAPLITQFYSIPELTQFLTALTGSDVITAPYEPEQIVVNHDTHGWHWDDYSYSLVVMLEAPVRENGAQVEFVDGTSWDKKSAQEKRFVAMDHGSMEAIYG